MIAFFVIVTISLHVCATYESLNDKFERLSDQIELLKAENAVTKAELEGVRSKFYTKEEALLTEIAKLRQECRDGMAGRVTSRRTRAFQTPVAFYAISPRDTSAMQPNVKLTYAAPFINIGNAFNNGSGTFIAPLNGIYVIFATVGGNIHSSNHFYIDVSGTMMSKVLQTNNGPTQSSSTVVVSLRAGDAVSVKSGDHQDGPYGGYFTTVGGFLLYENVNVQSMGK